jgi:serine/threonine protein kinase
MAAQPQMGIPSLEELEQRFLQIQNELISIRQPTDSLSYITKYRAQITLLTKYNECYAYYMNQGNIDGNLYQTRKNDLEFYRLNVENWAQDEENSLLAQFDGIYPPGADEPIKTNLGSIEFRKCTKQEGIFAVKWSRLRRGVPTIEDPVHEAWFCNFTGKDNHRRMLPLAQACTFRSRFLQIAPKATGGDLFKYLTSDPARARRNAKLIFSEICYSIDYLHNHLGVAHLDLKPENIFLDSDSLPILGDYGMARPISYPIHAHNTPQGRKFWSVRAITTTMRQYMDSHCVDEASLTALPPFSLSLQDFLSWNQMFAQLPEPIDLIGCVDSFILSPPTEDPSCPSAEVTGVQPGGLTFTYHDFLQSAICSLAAEQNIDALYYLDHNPVPVSVHQFVQYMVDNIQKNYPQLPLNYVEVRLSPNLLPSLYSQLCPDLSTLAIRPVTESLGTRAYMAPEVFTPGPNGRISYDPFKADIYSLGVVFFIIVYGFPPYRISVMDQNQADFDPAYHRLHGYAHKPIQRGQLRNPIVTNLIKDYGKSGEVDVSVTNLLDRMMDFNHSSRVSIKRIINEFLPNLVL